MEKPVIVSCINFEISPMAINESLSQNNGKLIVNGVIQRANSLNQNKRYYPRPILFREVDKYQQLIQERRALGELDHPESSVVNLSNASHLITKLEWNGDDLMGTIEVLGTPAGNILKALFMAGVSVGISSRGLGSTKDISDGAVEVQDDYEILCWDMVSNPSTQGAFVKPVALSEGVNHNNLLSTTTKYNKTNKIVMDILSSLSQR